jgi:hypothetical protein
MKVLKTPYIGRHLGTHGAVDVDRIVNNDTDISAEPRFNTPITFPTTLPSENPTMTCSNFSTESRSDERSNLCTNVPSQSRSIPESYVSTEPRSDERSNSAPTSPPVPIQQ